MTASFDAVFIGAGHNTLAAALHLAAKGWGVGVFERAAVAGGAVKTGEYTLPGFRHDWAAMNLSMFAGSGFFKQYSGELGHNGLEFVPVAHSAASVFPDGTWCGVSTDLEATVARIARFSARDAATWRAMVAAFPMEAPHIFGLLATPMRLSALAYFMLKTLRARGLNGSLRLRRFLRLSTRHYLTESFDSPQVQAMLAAWGMHLDFPPDQPGGAVFPYLEGMAGQAFGMVIGKGGADTIVKAMVAAIRRRGGVVECDAPVARILHKGGRAEGIELADGRVIMAGKAVVAGVAPSALTRLAGAMSPAFDGAMDRFEHAPGTMMMHMALDGPLEWTAGPELQKFAYVHVAPDLDQMQQTYDDAKAGLLPKEPVLVVGQPTAVDASRASPGQHVVWIQVRMVPGVIKGDSAGEIAATDWQDAGPRMAERVFAILERHAPGFIHKVLGFRIVDPDQLQADNPNLIGGDQLCGSHHLAQNFYNRPVRGHADGSTPVKNLYLTGAAVWPGAGTGAGSGYLLAQKLPGLET